MSKIILPASPPSASRRASATRGKLRVTSKHRSADQILSRPTQDLQPLSLDKGEEPDLIEREQHNRDIGGNRPQARFAGAQRRLGTLSICDVDVDADNSMNFAFTPNGRNDFVEMALLAVHLIGDFALHHLAGECTAIGWIAIERARTPVCRAVQAACQSDRPMLDADRILQDILAIPIDGPKIEWQAFPRQRSGGPHSDALPCNKRARLMALSTCSLSAIIKRRSASVRRKPRVLSMFKTPTVRPASKSGTAISEIISSIRRQKRRIRKYVLDQLRPACPSRAANHSRSERDFG